MTHQGPPQEPPDEAAGDDSIAELASLEEPTANTFVQIVRRKVERRQVTNHFLVGSWELTKIVLIELIDMVFRLFTTSDAAKGDDT